MSLKLDNVLRPFDGRESWLFWLEKFTTVAEFFEWTESQKIKYLALYLDKVPGRIFHLIPAEERTMDSINRKFTEAFMPSPVIAHSMLQTRKLREGESCEELWYSLVELFRQQIGDPVHDRPLVTGSANIGASEKVAGVDKANENMEFRAVVPYFLSALPVNISTQLRLINAETDLATLLAKTRMLLSIVEAGKVVGGMGTTITPKTKTTKAKPSKCFNCGDNHPRDRCPYPDAVCFTCKRSGHRSVDCPRKVGGPKNGVGAGPARQ
jgi:hypothetical protein